MSSSPFQSVFNSKPSSPQLSYHSDPNSVNKDESSGFMDYLIPFPNFEKSVTGDIQQQRQLDSGDLRFNDLVATGSPLLASETLSSSENSTFGSDNTAEVDDTFISQISCFSRLPDVRTGASTNAFASPSSIQQQSVIMPQPSTLTTSSTLQTQTPIFNDQNTYRTQIFSRSLPWVLSSQPPDSEDWVEWSGTVTICGRPVQLGGWEPPENDKFPLADVDLSCWVPWAPILLSNSQGFEDKPSGKQESGIEVGAKAAVSNAKTRRAEAAKTWARRLASNRLMPEPKKKRRVESLLPMQSRAPTEEGAALPVEGHSRADTMAVEDPSGSNVSNASSIPSAEVLQPRDLHQHQQELSANKEVLEDIVDIPEAETEADNKLKNKSTESEAIPLPLLSIPEYIYPLPAIAKAITQRAAEDERTRSIAENIRLQQQGFEGEEIPGINTTADMDMDDEEYSEETRRLMDEFFLFPDDMKETEETHTQAPTDSAVKETASTSTGPTSESEVVKSVKTVTTPSIKNLLLSAPGPALSIGVKQGLRPTRSLLDYSTSTRRRALVHFRSEVLGQSASAKASALSRKSTEEKVGGKRRMKDGPNAIALSTLKFLIDENENIARLQRPTVGVRAS